MRIYTNAFTALHSLTPLSAGVLLGLFSLCLEANAADKTTASTISHDGAVVALPETTVYASKASALGASGRSAQMSLAHNMAHTDAASAVARFAGVSAIRHGSQTGILQINGLAQERVKILVDNIAITPACPNHMDAPMHYVDERSTNNVTVHTGAAPIGTTGDSLGNALVVESMPLAFSKSGMQHTGSVSADYHGGYQRAVGALDASLNTERFALGINASTQTSDGLVSAKGDVAMTGFEKQQATLTVAGKINEVARAELALGAASSKDVGTPALGMDMIEDESSKISFKVTADALGGVLDASAFYHNIEHVMDNHSMRSKTPIDKRMRADASSRDTGGKLEHRIDLKRDALVYGVELHQQAFDVTQAHLAMSAYRDLIPNAKRARVGVFLENSHQHSDKLSSTFGVRTDWVGLSADNIEQSMMPDMAQKQSFNSANKDRSHTHVDALLAASYGISDKLTSTLTLTRNTRSPSMVETYLWKPSKTYAQGDGKSYLGSLKLNPETSHKIELALDYGDAVNTNAPSAQTVMYAQRVDDFIQGVAVSDKPDVLKFTNTEAKIYGINQSVHMPLTKRLAMDASLSYVRGKNTELDDEMYRINPLNGRASVTYHHVIPHPWSLTAEVVAAAKQGKVARYNDEQPSDGHAVLNLSASARPLYWLEVGAGVANVFDKYYAPHLAGINRVDNRLYNGHLAVGEKLPAEGRSGYGFVKLSW